MGGSTRAATDDEQVLVFGEFQLFRRKKLLLESGTAVRLGDRALDILVALVERAGEVVSKRELMSIAWPDTVVEEANLRVHIAALRKILSDGEAGLRCITNVSGRGYCFVAQVSRTTIAAVVPDANTGNRDALPATITRVIGRERVVDAIVEQMRRRRLVTIVGPAGVGKTAVGLIAARRVLNNGGRRVCFVDLAAVQEPSLVAASIATAVGISALAEDPIGSLVACLKETTILVVLDNCEHLITQVAECAERLVKETPAVDILATSREPLLAEGEWLYQLPPLQMPPESPGITPVHALTYSAVELFTDRAASSAEGFSLTPSNVCAVASICRQVDGIPLAIELAAARVKLFGVEDLARRLGEQMVVLAKGRRTASARHQSLRATLDWSYGILPVPEQVILRRLAVFRGPFSAESAVAVVATAPITEANVLEGIVSLAGKSLLTTDVSGQTIRYRLLHMTRAYATEKLAESDERRSMARRHGEHYRAVIRRAEGDWEVMSRSQWITQHGWMVDDVRAALEWAFSADGDIAIGTSLTAASLPFGFQLALIDEFTKRAENALANLAGSSPEPPITELRLTLALAMLYQNTTGAEERVRATLHKAVALARDCRGACHLIEPHVNLMVCNLEFGDHCAALECSKELSQVAVESGDPLAVLIADRAAAQAHHFAGDHARARVLAERVLRDPAKAIPLAYSQVSVDRKVSMRIILARILWLEGKPEQAEHLAAECVEIASSDSPFAICQALGLAACPIALWNGNESAADSYTASLLDYSRRYTLARWHTLGQFFQLELAGRKRSRSALPALARAKPASPLQSDLLATVSESWIELDTLLRAERALSGWCAPEVLRLRGQIHLRTDGTKAATAAESAYRSGLGIAREQRALAWELRIAMSIVELRRNEEARNLLHSVYERFTEGYDTSDLRRARELLERSDDMPHAR